MATSKITVTQGTGTDTGTYTGTEDAVTKHVGRIVLNNSALAEIGTAAAPVRTDPTGTTTQPVSDGGGALTVDGTVTANAGTGTFAVSATDLDIRNLAPATDEVKVTGAAADGAAFAGNPVLIGGQDGTNAQSIKTDANGELQVDVLTMPSTTVTATDLDIRDLSSATDSVAIGTALPAGTNNIGDVDIASALPAGTNNIGDVDLASAIPAGANKVGSVNSEIDPASAGTALTTKFASIDTATSGDNTIVAAVTTKKIRVLSVSLVCSAAVAVRWKSAAATNVSGAMSFAANGGYSAESQFGLLETTAGEALVLNLSVAQQVSGHVSYIEV